MAGFLVWISLCCACYANLLWRTCLPEGISLMDNYYAFILFMQSLLLSTCLLPGREAPLRLPARTVPRLPSAAALPTATHITGGSTPSPPLNYRHSLPLPHFTLRCIWRTASCYTATPLRLPLRYALHAPAVLLRSFASFNAP